MNVDDYREQVIALLQSGNKSGNKGALEDAANCVLYCSENAMESSRIIDKILGCLDDED